MVPLLLEALETIPELSLNLTPQPHYLDGALAPISSMTSTKADRMPGSEAE